MLEFGHSVSRQLGGPIHTKTVTLYFTDGKIERDAFGRYLAYIYLDGRDVSEWMLEDGLVWARPEPHPKTSIYESLNRAARGRKSGVYGLRKRSR